MSNSTALVTDAAKEAAQRTLDDYADGVAAHINGDWARHNQARVYDTIFVEPISTHQVSTGYLRLCLTQSGVDKIVKIPVIATEVVPVPGGAPLIFLQPEDLTVYVGSTATFTVGAASDIPITYQWYKNSVIITGETDSSLVITNAQTTDQAAYSVVCTNANGSTTSDSATLTVLPAPVTPPVTPESPEYVTYPPSGVCFRAGTLITLANGTRIPIEQLLPGATLKSVWLEGLDPNVEQAWTSWTATTLNTKPATTSVVSVQSGSYRYYYVLNGSIAVTYEHPFLVRRNGIWRWLRVQDLVVGDSLYQNETVTSLKTKVRLDQPIKTWTVDVEPYDTYFANGFLVHNDPVHVKD
jgi:hypothetical protein